MDPVTPVMEEKKKSPFFARYKFTIISLCIILLALIPLIIISKNSKNPTSAEVAKAQVTPTPTVIPLTQQNAAPTIDAVDTKIQSALDQSSQDIQAANQVDTTQDSTTGL